MKLIDSLDLDQIRASQKKTNYWHIVCNKVTRFIRFSDVGCVLPLIFLVTDVLNCVIDDTNELKIAASHE